MHDENFAPPLYQRLILSHLSPEDDSDFWSVAIQVLFHDVEAELEENHPKAEVYIQIGACSHWLRTHQTRWTASGGFAWPTGYGASSYSQLGLPEFDWFVLLRGNPDDGNWQPVEKFTGKRHLVFRAALPTRTLRHAQAAINTIWLPIRPSTGEQKSLSFYGFRKIDGIWQCVASQ